MADDRPGERIMKKRLEAAAVVAAMLVFLAACGSRKQDATSGEMVAPEVSSEDLLVSSLEYLLLDETEGEAEEPEEKKGQGVEIQGTDAQSAPMESESASAVIYYGSGGSSDLERETVEIEEMTPEELVNALARHNIMSLDTKVLAFEQKEEDGGGSVLYLDLSKAAGEYLRTMSEEAKSVIIASVIDTFLENYSADGICLTVEGQPLAGLGGEYAQPFAKCTPEELLELLSAEDSENGEYGDVSDAGEAADGENMTAED